MLTVSETLELPELQGAHVVAGASGLDRQVTWVHVSSVPDAPQWLNGGELVLTTALNLPQTPDEQERYVHAMAEKGVAALALAVGRHIDHAPAHMREVADAHRFPLIEVPYQARFVDIARATNQQISQKQMGMLERALTIHRALTLLVLQGGNLPQLAVTLAGLVGQSVSIENERFEALASHNIADVDEARRYTLSEGRTDPRLVTALEERGILGEIRRTKRPVHIPQMADVGLEMERILAPIVVHSNIYGYVWIIADDRPLSTLDAMAIEIGATIAALMLLHQEAIQNAEASLKGGLLTQLIEGGRETVLSDQALRFGVDLNAPFVMLLVQDEEAGSPRVLHIYRRINALAMKWRGVVGQFAGEVLMLASAKADIDAITTAIHDSLSDVRIGVSAVNRGANRVAAAHDQCRDALTISGRLKDQRGTVRFNDLGYLYALYKAGKGALTGNPHVPLLLKLVQEQQADLFHTLEAYLDAGGNGVKTAEVLSIHRSTLNYRLERIHEITDWDLGDPGLRMNLQVALKLLRLFEIE
ncbi:MAG: PucR family transcriptional regulator ligand-binding domain-containing protein, partial [Anaerolinea sp.]|nr:PucR family transcriptional regulator ligand-binding domain-containing protein [Anaerolinea sp.]